jgi:hypothetical protein
MVSSSRYCASFEFMASEQIGLGEGNGEVRELSKQTQHRWRRLIWEVRHGWIVDSGVGIKGISISVVRRPGSTRELVIDFPFSVFSLNRSPKRTDLIAALIPAVKAGIAAGWKPDSRGRTFRFKHPAE